MNRTPTRRKRPTRRHLLLFAALVVTVVGLIAAPLALAASTGDRVVSTVAAADRGTTVKFGENVTVAAGQTEGTVVAIGGNVYVHGTVRAAVSVGGNVMVDGTVERTVVAVGGDITLLGSAVVGSANNAGDTAIVLVGGALRKQPGATVTGDQSNVQGGWIGNAARSAFWDPIAAPYRLGSVVPWFVQTIVFAIIAVIVAATMPRQVRAVTRQLGRRTWASLGWGALACFIILPVSIVILAVTIIGLLVVVPGVAIGLPLLALFVGSCVAAMIGGLLLSRGRQRENLILAALIGVLVLSLLRFVPFVGAIAVLAASLFGVGAVVLAFAEWQRGRRELRRAARAAGGYGQPGTTAPGGGAPSPYAPVAPVAPAPYLQQPAATYTWPPVTDGQAHRAQPGSGEPTLEQQPQASAEVLTPAAPVAAAEEVTVPQSPTPESQEVTLPLAPAPPTAQPESPAPPETPERPTAVDTAGGADSDPDGPPAQDQLKHRP